MKNEEIIEFGKSIIETEINGLAQLKDTVSDNFIKACKLIYENRGKIICCGIGKSGHIAKKISATLASTGTPSFFIHPTEALHGDLGMISKQDIVLAISNSGNTTELSGIINYCIRFNITLIGITKNKNSLLGNHCNTILELPNAQEACSLGLAPTTSTTNTLALGDALAITLLHMRGFSQDDFKVFHPGGSLGSKLISLRDIIHREIPIINEQSTMKDAIIEITKYKFGCVAICNNKKQMIGIITDGDIRRHMDDNFLKKPVNDVMTNSFKTLTLNNTSSQALLTMENNKITCIFVLDEMKTPIGLIHIHDLLILGVQ